MQEVDVYLNKLSSTQQKELERIRKVIKDFVPDAIEQISYGMPAFKYKGKYLIAYGAFKDHYSIFPGASPLEQTKAKLKDYKMSKGTIQFTAEKPISAELIIELLGIRIKGIK